MGGAQRNPPALQNSFSLLGAKEPSMHHYLDKPIGVGEYRIMSRLPKSLKGQLPIPEQIEALLRDEEIGESFLCAERIL